MVKLLVKKLIIFSENYIFDGETYFYRDESGTKHKWNQASNKWEQQEVTILILLMPLLLYNQKMSASNNF